MKEIFPDLSNRFEYEYLGYNALAGGHQIKIKPELAKAFLDFLFRNQEFWCDYLVSISGEHTIGLAEQITVHYHLASITTGYQVHLHISKEINTSERVEFDSVSDLWKTAIWHERETGELYGIDFKGHPRQKNLLLPASWEGFPLRKNYVQQEIFHGVKVKY